MNFRETIIVNLKDRSYEIIIEEGLVEHWCREIKAVTKAERVFVIVDENVLGLHGERFRATLEASGLRWEIIPFRAEERYKNLETVSFLYDQLTEKKAHRHEPLVAVGGGIVGDVAGFVAATYQRGVPLIQFPTTLLAQVDSSIGGKVGIDHREGKNLIGSFYQPRVVLIDPGLLDTLPRREFLNGLAEVIKYGFIADPEILDFLLTEDGLKKGLSGQKRIRLIARCAGIKAAVVSQDEREAGYRMILNYGHTTGHAIEKVTGYSAVSHGQAVAVGMIVAAEMAHHLGKLNRDDVELHRRVIAGAGLPIKLPQVEISALLEAMLLDKKYGTSNRFVLLEEVGRPVVVEGVPEEIVVKSLLATQEE
ncbi:3-dehydroquinate synthase [Candidatus Hakubella thermalkaliphila]|uniref:3-dehydroquinate synthase n=1 Tax=Candidatus Hakubella thermalkaliphila TaxID=2754717 RepID=UPI001594BB4B|nr:3-dehydroquinate synthase [Candidatus Hakubella thermalkaliphila]